MPSHPPEDPSTPNPSLLESTLDPGDRIPLPTAPLAAGPTRYRVLRTHAQGGMGQVSVALDQELQREVAFKEIKANLGGDPVLAQRFVFEAKVTGQLEHPGVVPVYSLGLGPDGRPFYAMRFVQGDSLLDGIDRFHAADRAGRKSGERALALRGLLRRFIDVCNAVAYAHSKGVVHRDLKPANVMLGSFGETLVVDWGLARRVGSSPEQPRPAAPLPSTPGHTEQGAVVGTPAYMPPEQARGQIDQIGPASDVYSLGATLYHLLTGRAPLGGSTMEVLERVCRGEVPPPRGVNARVPRALEAVVRKAMAFEPGDRYLTAQDLAADVERWLADEPVTAYREPLMERLRRWGRRNRPVVTALAALVITGAVAAGVGLVLVNSEKQQKEQALLAESAALEASRLAERRARDQGLLALQTVRGAVDKIQASLKGKPGQQKLREALLNQATANLQEVARHADTAGAIDHTQVWVHLELAQIFLFTDQGGTAKALEQLDRARAIATSLVEADPDSAEARRDLAVTHFRLGEARVLAGDFRAGARHYEQSREIFEQLNTAHPDDGELAGELATTCNRLADVRLRLKDLPGAREACDAGLTVNRRRAESKSHSDALADLAVSLERVGDVQLEADDTNAALESFKESWRIRHALADQRPGDPEASRELFLAASRLGSVHVQRGDSTAGRDAYREALTLSKAMAEADPGNTDARRNVSASLLGVGEAEFRLGETRAAHDCFQEAIDKLRPLAKADPDSAELQRDLALAATWMGQVLLHEGDHRNAARHLEEAADIQRKLDRAAGTNPERQIDQAGTLCSLAQARYLGGDLKGSLEAARQAEEAVAPLQQARPDQSRVTITLLNAMLLRAQALLNLNDAAAAGDVAAKGRDLARARVEAGQAGADLHRLLTQFHTALGAALQMKDDTKGAMESLRAATASGRRGAELFPDDHQMRFAAANAADSLGTLFLEADDAPSALGYFKETQEMIRPVVAGSPANNAYRGILVWALLKLGFCHERQFLYADAARWYDEGLKAAAASPTPKAFREAADQMEGHLRFCRGVEAAIKDPSTALQQPEEERGLVLGSAMMSLARKKDADKTLAAADLMAKEFKDANGYFAAACGYALCVSLTDKLEVSEQRASRAVELLSEAVKKGFNDPKTLETEPNLTSVRDRADFKRLLEQVKRK